MIRNQVLKPGTYRGSYFKWRNHEVLRIEAFSDAVFAFAVTLIVVSLEVPVTFHEMLESMRGIAGFAISFLFLFMIWYQQYLYFRHFGLRDLTCMMLNAVLLFVVLCYVYPTKFLFILLTTGNRVMVHGVEVNRVASYDEIRELYVLYGSGIIAVYATFMLLYIHAGNKKHNLNLSTIEHFNLRTQVYKNIIFICFGAACLLIALTAPDIYVYPAGMIFMFIGPVLSLFFSLRAKKLKSTVTADELQLHYEVVEKSRQSIHSKHLE